MIAPGILQLLNCSCLTNTFPQSSAVYALIPGTGKEALEKFAGVGEQGTVVLERLQLPRRPLRRGARQADYEVNCQGVEWQRRRLDWIQPADEWLAVSLVPLANSAVLDVFLSRLQRTMNNESTREVPPGSPNAEVMVFRHDSPPARS